MIQLPDLQRTVPASSYLRGWLQQMLKKGVPPWSVIFALENLHTAELLSEMSARFQLLREVPLPAESISQLHTYWQSEEALWKATFHLTAVASDVELSPDSEPWDPFRDSLREWEAWTQLSQTDRIGALQAFSVTDWNRVLHETRLNVQAVLERSLSLAFSGFDAGEHLPDLVWDDSRIAPMMHLLTVYLPCCIHLRHRPHDLYLKAIRGDRRALREICSLDSEVRRIPEIASLIRTMISRQDPFLQEPLTSTRPLVLSLDRTAAKVLMIYWMREHSRKLTEGLRNCDTDQVQKIFGKNWTPPKMFSPQDLRGLFDAYARDHGQLVDEDLSELDEDALRKQVYRLKERIPADMWDIFRGLVVPVN